MNEELTFEYRWTFPDGEALAFRVRLNGENWSLRRARGKRLPEWTRLSYRQCGNCPLRSRRSCPPAAALVEFIEALKDRVSGTQVAAYTRQGNSTVSFHSGLSVAAGPLASLLVTTSGCPLFDRLRPYARVNAFCLDHFVSDHVLIGGYLMRQYISRQSGDNFQAALLKLRSEIEEIRNACRDFVGRFAGLGTGDAHYNALFSLMVACDEAHLSIGRGNLESLEGRGAYQDALSATPSPRGKL